MMPIRRAIAATIALASVASAAAPSTAQELRPVLTAASAKAIIAGCEAYAKEKKLAVAITVIDEGGNLVGYLRLDGTSLAAAEISRWKADSAAHWSWPTKQLSDIAGRVTSFAFAPHVSTFEGGEPIFTSDGKAPLGGVGVSGSAPTDDTACARAGITAAKLANARAAP